MATTTCIRNADWVVAWDATAGRHVYRRSIDVAFTDDRIVHAGPRYGGPVTDEIDGRGRCVMPGLVNIHCHPTNQPITRGVREELGNPRLYMSALYDRAGLWRADDDGLHASVEVAFGELIRSGVTTVVDYAARVPSGWIELHARSGLRVYAAPAFRDAEWTVENESRVVYAWDEAGGRASFEKAMALVETAERHPSGRIRGVIAPAQVDTCSAAMLQESARIARDRGLMWQTHCSQSMVEFHEMTRRHGVTPLQWLNGLGVLGPHATVAHAIFTDAHPWTHWAGRDDLRVLAATGTTVAHCPVVFSRYGQIMSTLGRYLRAGVSVGIGTDTAPHNMIEEMRTALLCSRIGATDIGDIATAALFDATTIAGARALGRDDIGRIAPGAKADLALIDLGNAWMRPVRDPLRSLVYTAADRAISDVFVDGKAVLRDGRLTTLDIEGAMRRLEAAQARAEAAVPTLDPKGRAAADLAPLVLPLG
ncbi:MAG: amidohydrolase family protein [Alphaproteobacteria bacterium]|nr:amidohydrolase family protein [Alphaproteobacteria bacterium]